MKRTTPLVFGLVALLAIAGCKAELYTGLTEREANEMVAALISSGIPATKAVSGEGITVSVDDARFAEAMSILDDRGLPARKYESMGEVFRKEGIVSSPVEERARLIYALSEELSRTIAEIDGVLSARIHVVLPEADMLGRSIKPSSASVFVRYAKGADVQNYSTQIKLLVANSIEGLLYDNITVVMVPAAANAAATNKLPELKSVLGIWVLPASAPRLWAVVGGLGAVIAALGGVVAFPFVRRALRKPKQALSGVEALEDEASL
ncbi:type III secretion system inner membrane ring lipoprotein SctJ [Paracoccus sp. (in: a-proteobacteria)]|uniref:type III secretion system inner membrane ring lipoprotein SctJ n=1 Tax=Paracoccus sp. TaxID=267 RepID=UPI003A8AEB37